MSRNPAALWLLIVALGLSACGRDESASVAPALSFSIESLADAIVLEVLSLDPEPGVPDAEGRVSSVKDGPTFHGWLYLGRSTTISKKDQVALLEELDTMLANPAEVTTGCYFPRHAVRLQTMSGDLDLLICFECSNLEIYDAAGKRVVFSAFQGAHEDLWYEIFERSGISKQLHPYPS